MATLISNYITVSIFGLEPALGFSVTSGVPLEYFPVLLMVGVIMGLCGVLFCRMIFAFKKFFEWLKCSRFLKLALTFVTVAVIGYDSQLLLGGGNDLVGQLAFQSHGVLLLGGNRIRQDFTYHLLLWQWCARWHILANARYRGLSRCLL